MWCIFSSSANDFQKKQYCHNRTNKQQTNKHLLCENQTVWPRTSDHSSLFLELHFMLLDRIIPLFLTSFGHTVCPCSAICSYHGVKPDPVFGFPLRGYIWLNFVSFPWLILSKPGCPLCPIHITYFLFPCTQFSNCIKYITNKRVWIN